MNEKGLKQSKLIYWASGIVSICGLIFEVLFGALGSYILGDGVKQYTLTISLFLTGMGVGASISERVTKDLVVAFIWTEFLVAVVGGFSSFLMFGMTAFAPAGSDALFLYTVTFTIGALTGVELPVLIRKANDIGVELNKSTARVLFSDYAGGLVGGLLFAFYLRPEMGMVKTAFFVGVINLSVAVLVLFYFREEIKKFSFHLGSAIFIGILLISGLFFGEELAFSFEQKLYKDPILHMENTSYQKMVLTKDDEDTRLFLDGALQFSSTDEYRYHETLVHLPMAYKENVRDVLVLGGGDGIAVNELLKYEGLESITLVDLDPAVVDFAKENPHLRELNDGALDDPLVDIQHKDAFKYLKATDKRFDTVLIDLPDPNNESLNKLYTKEFYSLVRNHLRADGVMMAQATSPVFAPEVYWTINETVEATDMNTYNFHVDIPSFGNWGFVMASRKDVDIENISIDVPTEFLNEEIVPALTVFGKDEDREILDSDGQVKNLEPNTLIHPNLIQKYEQAWKDY
ncbi:spermidine synthase [Salimicrobium jeotgali]|uniref:Polyamine aminopropyltransferase n=2 Tax=Salimicrobium TaxID=351195 RepID=K2G6X9_9BACI|nr:MULTISPECIES: polyamine aminopropyltransferase [Salimicrobium]AKG04133.1 spermidine synthase [Salimicrobium jeotgali]EKE30948.1 spermidine synthase [Salimicrobium jeotgali]MBM7697413.1 spermidine synthase [Salimicrobium jeotgali]PBB06702.1 spermidine synthase [Salimicrobium humidisoli]